jgi:hypothetical protein
MTQVEASGSCYKLQKTGFNRGDHDEGLRGDSGASETIPHDPWEKSRMT